MKKYIVILFVLTCSSVNASNQLNKTEVPIKKSLIKKAENNKEAIQKKLIQEKNKLAIKDKVFAKPTTKIKLAINKKAIREKLLTQQSRIAKNAKKDLPSLSEKP